MVGLKGMNEIKHDIAQQLVTEALLLGEILNRMFASVNKIENSNTKTNLMKSIEMLVAHSTDVILDIEKIYPDLNPDK